MLIIKRKAVFWLGIIFVWLIATTIYAQGGLPLTETYTDDSITFQYPQGWRAEAFSEGLVEIYPEGAAAQSELSIAVILLPYTVVADLPSALEVLSALAENYPDAVYDEPYTIEFDGRSAAAVTFSVTGASAEGITYVVELTDDGLPVVMVTATLATGELATWQNTIAAIVASIAPPDMARSHFTSSDGLFTISYPTDWVANEVPGVMIAVANSSEALRGVNIETERFPTGEVVIIIYPTSLNMPAYPTDAAIEPETIIRTFLDEQCEVCGFTEVGGFAAVELGDKIGYEGYASHPNFDTLNIAVNMGNDTVATYMAFAAPGEMAQYSDAVHRIVADSVSHIPSAPETIDAAYTTSDGSFIVYYPEDWVVDELPEGEDFVVLVTAFAEAPADVDHIQPGNILIYIFPTFAIMANLFDYPTDNTPATVASTIVSFFASVGYTQGYQQVGPMGILEIDGRDASSSWATHPYHERLVMSIATANNDFVTLMAYTAPGWMERYQPVLEEILGAVEGTK